MRLPTLLTSHDRSRLSPLLILSPLLAVSDSVINALGLSIVAILVTLLSALPMSVALQRLSEYSRIAAVVVIVAGVVTSALLLMHAWFYTLYVAIGAYVPLLVASGLLLTRYDVVTPREKRSAIIWAGLRTGIAFSFALITLGAAREFVGHGSILFGVNALPGRWSDAFGLQLFPVDLGFVLAILPPGAFIAMGILFAVRNWYFASNREKAIDASISAEN